jgi:hypothetical protein
MDKQLEQRIRERAYELWMQHGSLPGRADEYWYQAEQEVLGRTSQQDESSSLEQTSQQDESSSLGQTSQQDESGSLPIVGSDEESAVVTDPAPLGMTSQTLDEVLSSPAAPKPRRRKSTAAEVSATAAEVNQASGDTVVAPKRRRSTKTPT